MQVVLTVQQVQQQLPKLEQQVERILHQLVL